MSMPLNLPHHVRNITLPKSRALLPLFEAIVNSLQAIADRPGAGTIRLVITRDASQAALVPTTEPIQTFAIIDDGVGFTKINFDSFSTASSDHRAALGGKGVGRLLWLKAFNKVSIDSTFSESGVFMRRRIAFSLDGVDSDEPEPVASGEYRTVVTLDGFKAPYCDGARHSLSTLAHKLLQHCMHYFISPRRPRVIIEDDAETIDIATIFEEEVVSRSSRREFSVNGFPFHITNFCLLNRSEHLAHLCVDDREVTDFSLDKLIPELTTGKIKDDDNRPFAIASYVGGAYLDAAANSERTDFVFDDEVMVWDGLSRKELREAIADEVRRDFAAEIDAVAHDNALKLRDFIDDHPEFRILNSHPEELLTIPATSQPEKLRVELYRATNRLRERIRELGREILSMDFDDLQETEEYKARFSHFVNDLNELGKSDLANYVIHRKVVLEVLGKAIRRKEDGNYHKEEAVHQLIFPLRATSNDVELRQQNLWILDERFSFHKYLNSDMPLSSTENGKFKSADRPDLLIFNKCHILSEDLYPIQSIVLIEFKRPMRTKYNKQDDNPVAQAFRYLRKIRAGGVTTTDGRPVDVKPATPFYVYIICDLTKKAREVAADYGFKPTPDGLGMFHLHDADVQAYMEIVPLEKVIMDAEKRNKILFDALSLP